MNTKKFAVRGLLILAVVVALCMYFSGTITTITTPKIKLLSVKQGKLEETMSFTGALTFTQKEEKKVTVPEDGTIIIKQVYVRTGDQVKAGDVLFEAAISGYDAQMATLLANYNAALDEVTEFERKNNGVTLSRREEEYANAYMTLKNANRLYAGAKLSMDLLLSAEKTTYTEEGYPENAGEELIAAIDAYRAALADKGEAQAAFETASRYTIDDSVWNYITEKQTVQEKAENCREKVLALQESQQAVVQITAPHSGYIASVAVKTGDSYDGKAALYTMTGEEGVPALQIDISQIKRTISKGDTVSCSPSRWGQINLKVLDVGFDTTGKKCAYVEVNEDMGYAYGSLYAISQQEIPLKMTVKATTTTCLVPTGAIHGTDNDRYVFVVDSQTSTLGGRTLKLTKMPVTVLAEAGGFASVEEDVSYYQLAYMEDRAISDGATVMEYTE